MAHHHHHHHHDAPSPGSRLGRAFLLGIGLNLVFVVVEAVAGFMTGSLALLTDAGHNLSDVGSLILAFFAFRLAMRKPTRAYSYGYRKSTIWASLLNGLLLMMVVGGIGFEAIKRLADPPPIPGYTVAIVAGVGILINSLSAWLFHRDKEHDLNVKGAYLHLAADAAVSVGVMFGGLVMQRTGWLWLDPAISFAVLAVIVWSTWDLLMDSIRLALDGVPPKVDPSRVEQVALGISGITGIHHIHIWAMSTTENALTAHLVLSDGLSPEDTVRAKHEFRHELEHLNIRHATLETEFEFEDCQNRKC